MNEYMMFSNLFGPELMKDQPFDMAVRAKLVKAAFDKMTAE
jgi:hypothetical protein